MSDLKAELHQIRFSPQIPLGELTALPHPLAVFKAFTCKGRQAKGIDLEGEGRGEGKAKGKGEEGK